MEYVIVALFSAGWWGYIIGCISASFLLFFVLKTKRFSWNTKYFISLIGLVVVVFTKVLIWRWIDQDWEIIFHVSRPDVLFPIALTCFFLMLVTTCRASKEEREFKQGLGKYNPVSKKVLAEIKKDLF